MFAHECGQKEKYSHAVNQPPNVLFSSLAIVLMLLRYLTEIPECHHTIWCSDSVDTLVTCGAPAARNLLARIVVPKSSVAKICGSSEAFPLGSDSLLLLPNQLEELELYPVFLSSLFQLSGALIVLRKIFSMGRHEVISPRLASIMLQ